MSESPKKLEIKITKLQAFDKNEEVDSEEICILRVLFINWSNRKIVVEILESL